MCSNYDPVLDATKLKTHFGVGDLPVNLKPRLWPGYVGPFVRKHEHADVGDEAIQRACSGLFRDDSSLGERCEDRTPGIQRQVRNRT